MKITVQSSNFIHVLFWKEKRPNDKNKKCHSRNPFFFYIPNEITFLRIGISTNLIISLEGLFKEEFFLNLSTYACKTNFIRANLNFSKCFFHVNEIRTTYSYKVLISFYNGNFMSFSMVYSIKFVVRPASCSIFMSKISV